jgi:hypothetical protein
MQGHKSTKINTTDSSSLDIINVQKGFSTKEDYFQAKND